jgi:hypothetical protein
MIRCAVRVLIMPALKGGLKRRSKVSVSWRFLMSPVETPSRVRSELTAHRFQTFALALASVCISSCRLFHITDVHLESTQPL